MLHSHKTCSRCKATFAKSEFPTSTAYGKPVVRSWCKTCLKKYYAARRSTRKVALVKEETSCVP